MRTDRVTATVPTAVMVALDHLCYKTGLSRSAQAMVLLRQALDRTMGSAEVQEKIKRAEAYRTAAQWAADQAATAEQLRSFAALATMKAMEEGAVDGAEEDGAGGAEGAPLQEDSSTGSS